MPFDSCLSLTFNSHRSSSMCNSENRMFRLTRLDLYCCDVCATHRGAPHQHTQCSHSTFQLPQKNCFYFYFFPSPCGLERARGDGACTVSWYLLCRYMHSSGVLPYCSQLTESYVYETSFDIWVSFLACSPTKTLGNPDFLPFKLTYEATLAWRK